jgi:hypothetical protein
MLQFKGMTEESVFQQSLEPRHYGNVTYGPLHPTPRSHCRFDFNFPWSEQPLRPHRGRHSFGRKRSNIPSLSDGNLAQGRRNRTASITWALPSVFPSSAQVLKLPCLACRSAMWLLPFFLNR